MNPYSGLASQHDMTTPQTEPKPALIDPFGRRIEYVRLSLTDKCNLRCFYCMPKGFNDFEQPENWLTFDEIERVIKAFTELGVARVRLTGGEPLVRKNIAELADRLTALPGLDVENPRQVSAWRYPRQYGPRSPLFSRGTILRLNGSQQFLISGTASVVGHQTHHENQVANQLSESLRNVRSLLEEGHRLTGDSHAQLDNQGLLKVYIRNREDFDLVRQTLEAEAPPEIPRIYLEGDICRENLLTEIDGIVSLQRRH